MDEKKKNIKEDQVMEKVRPQKRVQTAEGWKRSNLKAKEKEMKSKPRKSEAA